MPKQENSVRYEMLRVLPTTLYERLSLFETSLQTAMLDVSICNLRSLRNPFQLLQLGRVAD